MTLRSQSSFCLASVISDNLNNCSTILKKFLSIFICPFHLGTLGLRGVGICVFEGMFVGAVLAAGLVCQITGLEIKDCCWFVVELSLDRPYQGVSQGLRPEWKA